MTDKPDISQIKIAKPNPLIAFLPAHLKDPKNYKKIQKAIIEAGATKHSHGEISEWSACKHCTYKQHARAEMMRKLGFKNGAQYMTWKRIHEEILNLFSRDKLPKYDE